MEPILIWCKSELMGPRYDHFCVFQKVFYKFSGSKAQVYKQIGNAVPVNLAKAIAQEVMKVLV